MHPLVVVWGRPRIPDSLNPLAFGPASEVSPPPPVQTPGPCQEDNLVKATEVVTV